MTELELRAAREKVKANRRTLYQVTWRGTVPSLESAPVDIGPSWARGTFFGYETEKSAQANGWWSTPERAMAEAVLEAQAQADRYQSRAKIAESLVGKVMAGKVAIRERTA